MSETPEQAVRRNRQAYARIAAEWERRLESGYDSEFHARCRAGFLQHLSGNRVLDAGCGLGLDTAAFAAQGLRVTALDIAPEFLALVKRRCPEAALVAADLSALCFRAEAFDGIFALASFLHVPRPLGRSVLASLAGLLAPGGVLYLHHVASSQGLEEYRIDGLLIPDNPALCYCHAPEELAALLAAEGMRTVSTTRFRPARHPSESAVRHGLEPYQMAAVKPSAGTASG